MRQTDREVDKENMKTTDRRTDRQTCREKLEEIKTIYRERQTITLIAKQINRRNTGKQKLDVIIKTSYRRFHC